MSAPERHNGDRGDRRPLGQLAEIERYEDDGVLVVSVAGELDVSNVGTLAEVAYDVPNDALGLVLDLCDTTYIDSATIGLLFKLHGSLRRRGQALRVVCPSGSSARRVLELTGFDQSTPNEEDRERAIVAIRREVPLGG
jgi:anti-anti-sigma factor